MGDKTDAYKKRHLVDLAKAKEMYLNKALTRLEFLVFLEKSPCNSLKTRCFLRDEICREI